MRTRNVSILCLLLAATAAQVALAQTRPRRVEDNTPSPSPSPPQLIKRSDAEPASADPPPSEVKVPNGKDTPDDDVIRIDTTLVTIPVSVTDRLGRPIPDLERQDFHVYEEGIEQQIAYFAAVEKPFTVILMIDTSASNWSKLGQIRAAAKAFVDQLRPDDQVMVASFAGGLTIEGETTSDRQKIRKAIDKTGKGLSTHLYDAMDKMMQKHLSRIQGRKAVVIFTDGVDASSNRATYEGTLREAEELDAIIYPILYDTYDASKDNGPTRPTILGIPIGKSNGGGGTSRAAYNRGDRYLHELAKLTGGHVYEASRDLRYLTTAFSNIAEELRRQYSLGYYPKQSGVVGERRRLTVKVSRQDLAVRTRDSYIFKGNTGAPATGNSPEKKSSSPPVLEKKPLVSGD